MKSLTELESQLGTAKNRKMLEALKACEAAATSGDKAYSLYMDCKKSVDFDEKGKTGTEFGEWKRGEGGALHDPESTLALQHQLKWLALTLKASMAEKETEVAEVIQQIPPYLDAMLADWKKMKRHSRVLRDNAADSIYAKYFKLDQIMEVPNNWSTMPGDIDGIYEMTLLPWLREKKNAPLLASAWQRRIAQITNVIEIEVDQEKQRDNDPGAYVPKAFNPPRLKPEQRVGGNAEERLLVFKKEGLPRLQWGMHRDAYMLGAEVSASNLLLGLIKSNLGHPDAPQWLAQLQSLVKGEPLPDEANPPSPASSPASEVSPADGTAPAMVPPPPATP